MQLLKIEGLSKSFGGLKAVNDVSFTVNEGEIVGLIGPNGSGKTTTLNLLTGFLKSDSGTITFQGQNITGYARSDMCPTGISRTFQLVKPFLGFTALQNVMVGRVFGRESTKDLRRAAEECKASLDRVGLADKANMLAKDLTLMQRKRLELARALAAKPQLLLLDELMAGLNLSEADDVCNLILKIRDSKITILIIEHIVKAILTVSDRVVVLNMGTKIAEGPALEIIRNPQVIDVYLGRARA
jgi:branched-chain amino acid transport system ATP-binding protein